MNSVLSGLSINLLEVIQAQTSFRQVFNLSKAKPVFLCERLTKSCVIGIEVKLHTRVFADNLCQGCSIQKKQ